MQPNIILAQNMNGQQFRGSANCRKRILTSLIEQVDPSVILASETMWVDPKKHIENISHYRCVIEKARAGLFVDSTKFSIISHVWDVDLDKEITDKRLKKRFIIALLEEKRTRHRFVVCSVHGPHSGFKKKDKEAFVDSLLTSVQDKMVEWKVNRGIVGGDFNLSQIEINKIHQTIPIARHRNYERDIDNFIALGEWSGLNLKGKAYKLFKKEVIDVKYGKKVLQGNKLNKKVEGLKLPNEAFAGASLDHDPIIMQIPRLTLSKQS